MKPAATSAPLVTPDNCALDLRDGDISSSLWLGVQRNRCAAEASA